MSNIIKQPKSAKTPVKLSKPNAPGEKNPAQLSAEQKSRSLDFSRTVKSEISRITRSFSRQISLRSREHDREMRGMSRKANEEGYKAGFDDAIEKERSERIEAIDKLLTEAKKKSENALHGLELKIIDIAVFLAEQITHKIIATHPEVIEGIIQETMSYLIGNETVILKVSEDDFKMVNAKYDKWLDKAGSTREFRIEVDRRLKRGDCIIETEGGIIDAAVSHRLETLAEELVKESS